MPSETQNFISGTLTRTKEWFIGLSRGVQAIVIIGVFVAIASSVWAIANNNNAVSGLRLYLSPSSASVSRGDVLNLDIMLDTAGEDITAVSAFLIFDRGEGLFTINCSLGSCPDVAVGEDFDTVAELQDAGGELRIVVGATAPVNGNGIRVATASFKVSQTAPETIADITFNMAGSSAIVNDGFGTDKLSEAVGGSYVIGFDGGLGIIEGPATVSGQSATDVTVKWTTNIASDGTVYYGTTSCSGCTLEDFRAVNAQSQPQSEPDSVLHSVDLPDLAKDQVYYYMVESKAGELSTVSDEQSFYTGEIGKTPPEPFAIRNLSVDPGARSAIVSWSTNKLSDSKAVVTPVQSGGSEEFNDEAETLSHSIKITGLSPLTSYEADVSSTLPDKSETVSSTITFTTLAEDLSLDSNIVLKARRDRVCGSWLECTSSVPVENLEGFKEELCFDLSLCTEIGPDGKCVKFKRQQPSELVYTIAKDSPDKSSIEGARFLSGYSKVGARWIGGSPGTEFVNTYIPGAVPVSRMEQKGSSLTIPNGDFEDGRVYPWVPRWYNAKANIKGLTDLRNTKDRSDIQSDSNKVLQFTPRKWDSTGKPLAAFGASSSVAGIKVPLGKTVRDGVQYYVSMDVMSGGISERELIVQFGFNDYEFFKNYATDIIPVSNSWKRVVIGPLEVKKEDLPKVGKQTYLGILYDMTNTAPPYQPFFIDNVKIEPVLMTRPGTFITKSCRSYASSDAPACRYYDASTGREFQGWEGYCVEVDPRNPRRCIQWLPIDVVAGSQSIESSSVRVGYGSDKSIDRFPLYYCTEARGNAPYIRKNIQILEGFCKKKKGWFGKIVGFLVGGTTGGPIGAFLGYKAGSDGDRYSGIYIPDGKTMTSVSTKPDGFQEADLSSVVVRYRFARDDDSCTLGGDEQQVVLNQENQFEATGEVKHDINKFTYITFTRLSDGRYKIFGDATTGDGSSGYIIDIIFDYYLREWCQTVSQVVDPFGNSTAFAERVGSDEYVVPNLGYKRDQDFAPFGAIVNANPDFDPTKWDSNPDLSGKQPLYIEPPDKTTFPTSPYQVRGGSPYGVVSGREVGRGICISGGNVGQSCNTNKQCDGDKSSGYCTGVIPPEEYNEVEYLRNINQSTRQNGSEENIANLFARSTAVWTWDESAGQYRQVCAAPGVCVDDAKYTCDGGFSDGKECDPASADADCGIGISCSNSKAYGWDVTSDFETLPEGTGVCTAGLIGSQCTASNECDVTGGESTCEPVEYCSTTGIPCEERACTAPGFCVPDDVCVGGYKDGQNCISDSDCSSPATVKGVCSLDSGTNNLYSPNLRPPSVFNLRVKGPSQDSINDPNADIYISNNQGSVTLTFNSLVSANQLPLTRYTVDWGDGRISEESSMRIRYKSQEDNPHLLSHTYFCDDTNGDGKVDSSDYPADVWDSTLNACVYKPKVSIEDGWNWCSGSVKSDGSTIKNGIDNYAGTVGKCVGGDNEGSNCYSDGQCGAGGTCEPSSACDSWDKFGGRIIVCPENVAGGASCNKSPVAVLSSDVSGGTAPLVVDFDLSSSYDPDGSIVSWSFSIPGGRSDSVTSGSGQPPKSVQVEYDLPGTYEAVLSVTDDAGVFGTATSSISVSPVPLTVSMPDVQARTGDVFTIPVNLSGVASQSYSNVDITIEYDSSLVTYTGERGSGTLTDGWNFSANESQGTLTLTGSLNGGSAIESDGTIRELLFTAGTTERVAEFNVTGAIIGPGNPNVSTENGSVDITLIPPPTITSFTATPNSGVWPLGGVEFRVSVSDEDGRWPVTIVIDPDLGQKHDPPPLRELTVVAYDTNPVSVIMQQSYDKTNVYTARATATNDAGRVSTPETTEINVTDNAPPIITDFRFNQTNSPIAIPMIGNFTANITDAEGNYPITYSIDFGDSTASSQFTLDSPGGNTLPIVKTYNSPGKYTATITATDNLNNQSTATYNIAVDWWNSDYRYRRQLTVQNNAHPGVLPNEFPVQFTMSTDQLIADARMRSDGSDLRVIYDDGSGLLTEIDRQVINMNSPLTYIWFRTKSAIPQGGSDGSYWVYYGYDGTGSPGTPKQNPANVFQPANDSNTAALYYFEEGSGTSVIDSSGNGNNGSIDNPAPANIIPTWRAGRFGYGLDFAGNDTGGGAVSVPSDTIFESSVGTVEFWVRVSGQNREQAFFSKDHVGIKDGGHILAEIDDGSGSGDPGLNVAPWQTMFRLQRLTPAPSRSMHIFSDDTFSSPSAPLQWTTGAEWAHIAVVWLPDGMEMYVNGVLQSNDPYGDSAIESNGTIGNKETLWIGANSVIYDSTIGPSTLQGFLNGRIDGFRWSNVPRTSFPYAEVLKGNDPTVSSGVEDNRDLAYLQGETRVAGASDSNLKRSYNPSWIVYSFIEMWNLIAGD